MRERFRQLLEFRSLLNQIRAGCCWDIWTAKFSRERIEMLNRKCFDSYVFVTALWIRNHCSINDYYNNLYVPFMQNACSRTSNSVTHRRKGNHCNGIEICFDNRRECYFSHALVCFMEVNGLNNIGIWTKIKLLDT